jgi:hypothetical protein
MNRLLHFAHAVDLTGCYRCYNIPKKCGGKREISAPAPQLKSIQAILNEALVSEYLFSPNVCGFVKSRSILSGAVQHIGRSVLLNLDIKDFFPSITEQMVVVALQERLHLKESVAELIASICTVTTAKGRVLPQGSPTSPFLSNLVCVALDEEVQALASQYGIIYTRYADDISLSASSEDVLREESDFRAKLQQLIEASSFKLNTAKSRITRPGRRMEVTGIVVERRANVPRSYVLELRQLLFIWEHYGYKAVALRYSRHHHSAHRRVHAKSLIAGKIAFLEQIRGKEDPIARRYRATFERLCQKKGSVATTPSATTNLLDRPIKVGAQVSIDTLKEQLHTLGYSRCDTVYAKGSYACRGGIIDVFLFGEQKPIRIEFFDNTVESIHYFNLQTQVIEECISDFSLSTSTPSPAFQRPVVAPKPKKTKQATQKETLEERPSNGSSNQFIKFLLIAILFVLLLLLLKY